MSRTASKYSFPLLLVLHRSLRVCPRVGTSARAERLTSEVWTLAPSGRPGIRAMTPAAPPARRWFPPDPRVPCCRAWIPRALRDRRTADSGTPACRIPPRLSSPPRCVWTLRETFWQTSSGAWGHLRAATNFWVWEKEWEKDQLVEKESKVFNHNGG